MLPRSAARDEIATRQLPVALEVDGGVGPDDVADLAAAGVTIAVAGAAVFGSGVPGGGRPPAPNYVIIHRFDFGREVPL